MRCEAFTLGNEKSVCWTAATCLLSVMSLPQQWIYVCVFVWIWVEQNKISRNGVVVVRVLKVVWVWHAEIYNLFTVCVLFSSINLMYYLPLFYFTLPWFVLLYFCFWVCETQASLKCSVCTNTHSVKNMNNTLVFTENSLMSLRPSNALDLLYTDGEVDWELIYFLI